MKFQSITTTCSMAAVFSGVAGVTPFAEAGETRPNFLFILSDDHSHNAISAYTGGTLNQTPNIDRIANEGMRFDATFCISALCKPSRATILTGKHSHKHGLEQIWCFEAKDQTAFDNSQETVATLLQGAGYQTAVVGKWHLFVEPHGFDYYNVLIGSMGQGEYWSPLFLEQGQERKYDGAFVEDVIADESLRWLKQSADDPAPFALFIHPKTPHAICYPKEEHAARYEGVVFPEPGTIHDDHSGRSRAAAGSTQRLDQWGYYTRQAPDGLSTRELRSFVYQRYIRDYVAVIDAMDENIGRVLDYLDETGQLDNTVVIYTSDQGMFLGDHGWYNKQFMYEEPLRMPFVVRYPPEITAGSVNTDMALNLDFAQTLLDFAGVEAPDDMQGRSLRPLMRGERPQEWRDAFFYQHYGEWVQPHIGVRTEDFKLIHFYCPNHDEWELYDLRRDPDELNNVYHDSIYADTVSYMKNRLAEVQEESGYTAEVHADVLRRWDIRLEQLERWSRNR